jgi:hypothetical protein
MQCGQKAPQSIFDKLIGANRWAEVSQFIFNPYDMQYRLKLVVKLTYICDRTKCNESSSHHECVDRLQWVTSSGFGGKMSQGRNG